MFRDFFTINSRRVIIFMKKILFIGSLPPPHHGTNVFFQYIFESKLSEYFDLHLLDIKEKRTDFSNLGKIDFYNVYYSLKNIAQLFILMISYKPDIIYLCPSQGLGYIRDGLFILTAKLFSRNKVIEHLHGSNFLEFYKKSSFFLKKFIDITQYKVDLAIVLGEKLKHNFTKWLPMSKIKCLPNGIPDLYFPVFSDDNSTINILFLGNLFKFKGFLTAVEAFGKVSSNLSSIFLNIAGNWGNDSFMKVKKADIKNEFERLISTYNIHDRVKLYGPVLGERKKQLLESSQIFLYPTSLDGLPYVLLEAMSAGLPIISSRHVGVIEDVVIDGTTGILTETQDIDEITNALTLLITNNELRRNMSVEARKRFENLYILNKHIENLKEILLNA